MTIEQIERASVTMKESQNYHMSFEDAQDYISKCGFDIPWKDGDVFVDEREITRTVGNVLKWRINSVWHDVREKPNAGEFVLIQLAGSERFLILFLPRKRDYLSFIKRDSVIGWAYVSDLIPERKEETE